MRVLAILVFALAVAGCSTKAKKGDATATPAAASADNKAAAKKATPSEGQITCKFGGETRTLEVVKDDQGCKTMYNKNGADHEMATGNASGEYCQSVLEKIKGNLEAAGYTCN